MSEKSLCGEKKKKKNGTGGGIFEVTVKQAVKCSLGPAGRLDLASPVQAVGGCSHMSGLSHLAEGEVNLGSRCLRMAAHHSKGRRRAPLARGHTSIWVGYVAGLAHSRLEKLALRCPAETKTNAASIGMSAELKGRPALLSAG